MAHDYSAPGDYQIKIQKQVGKSYILGKNNNNQAAPTAVIMPSARLTNISLSWDITSVNNFAFANTSIASLQLTPYITSIANGMFKDCKNLTSIELPEYIETIGQSAFEGCSYLAGIITIPERTNTIGNNAFKACTSLSGINLNSRVSAIPNQFCAWCNALSEVNIPADSHITTVGGSAFFSCLALQSIELPASVRVLGMTVFGLCSSLSTIVLNSPELTSIASTNETINGGIVTPGSGTFTDIVGLRKVGTLDDADANLKLALTTTVPDNMFRGVTSIKVVHLPDTITSIGEFAFASNTNLETIILPSALETINDNAFYNTPKLMSINLDNTPHLQTIGRYAFAQAAGSTNSGLRSIKIPYSVQTIREFAFSSCRQLSEVEIYTPSFEPKVSDTDHLIFHWCSNLTVLKIPQEVGLEGAVAAYGEYFNYTASAQSVTPIADLPL